MDDKIKIMTKEITRIMHEGIKGKDIKHDQAIAVALSMVRKMKKKR